MTTAPPAHYRARDAMDLTRLERMQSGWGSSYHDGLVYSYALGRNDWPPLLVACAALASSDPATLALALHAHWWLAPESEELATWVAANRGVFETMLERLEEATVTADRDTTLGLAPEELGWCFEVVELTSIPPVSQDQLTLSKARSAYLQLPAMSAFRKIRPQLKPEFVGVASAWFAHRGIAVDEVRQEIHLPGYQALYFMARQDF